jgi:hypothetical protein
MDVVARETIAEPVDASPVRALSLFLPTHRAGPDSRPYERQLQYRSIGRTGGGRRTALFHGHGDTDDVKEQILRFCQQVDRAFSAMLHGGNAPVVLAAVDSIGAIYRQTSTLPRLLDQSVVGNPDDASAADLQERAWAIVEPVLRGDRAEALTRYHELSAPNLTTRDLARAVVASHDGQIDVLFVERGAQSFDEWIGVRARARSGAGRRPAGGAVEVSVEARNATENHPQPND